MTLENVSALQVRFKKQLQPEVLLVTLANRMSPEELAYQIKRLVKLGQVDYSTKEVDGTVKNHRLPWLNVFYQNAAIQYQVRRHGFTFYLAELPRASRFSRGLIEDEQCERFLRFVNLCSAKLWPYMHQGVIPEHRLILTRSQLKFDSDPANEPDLNRLVDVVINQFKNENLLSRSARGQARALKQEEKSELTTLRCRVDSLRAELDSLRVEMDSLKAAQIKC